MELFNEPIIQQKVLSDIIKKDNVITNATMVGGSFNGGKITIGSGENIFTANKDGIFLGSSSFETAPFSVDVQGNLTANNVSLSGAIKTGAGSQINGTYIDSLTANKITAGTIDANIVTINNLTVGTNVNIGTAQDSAGVTTIIGNTVTTGYVNALAVVAGSVAAENITGTCITGKTVQTSITGDRIIMNGSTNKIEFKNGTTLYASMLPYYSNSGSGFQIATHGDYTGPASLIIYEGISSNSASITADTINLNGQIPKINLNGVTRTSWPTAFSGNLSDLSINTAKNWGSYNITNLGSLIPGSGTTTLGNSSYYWSNMYIHEIYGAYGIYPIYMKNNIDMNSKNIQYINDLDVNGNCDIEGFVDINNYLTVHGIFTAKGKMYAEGGLYMNNLKIEGVANPTSAQDAATKAWVEANFQAKS